MNSMAENLNGAVENCRMLWRHKDLRARTSRKAQNKRCGIPIGSPHRLRSIFSVQRAKEHFADGVL